MASENVKEFTTVNWDQEVVNSDVPVVVDFWAPWCGPCRQLAPTIDKLAEQYAGRVKVGKLNTDDNQPRRGTSGMASPRDALRVQAAAVAAQQAALTEDELRLRQQRQALEQQQTQLVAHLDEKRGRLIELRDQARQAYAELKAERAKFERSIADTARQLEASRAEIAGAKKQVQDERDRLRRLW